MNTDKELPLSIKQIIYTKLIFNIMHFKLYYVLHAHRQIRTGIRYAAKFLIKFP
jgi:hypothetical protein